MTLRFGWLPTAMLVLCTTAVFAQEAKTQQAPLVIGTALDYPPYSFLDENGQAAGYNVDLTRAVAEAVGLDVEIRIGPWSEIRKALETGKIDAIAGMFYSAKRHELVDFSPPYTIIHHAIFLRRGSPAIETEEDLRGKDIIVTRGDIMHDYVLDNGLCDRPVLVDTQADALRLLASGKHDCALAAKLPGLHWSKELGLSNIVTAGLLLRPSNYCYAVAEGNTALRRRLGEGVAILGETGAHEEIYDKWLGVLQPRGLSAGTVLLYVGFVAVPLVLLLTLFAVWSRTLKRQVARRTKDLRQSEERYRAVVEGTPVLICRFLPGGEITYVNEAYCRYFEKTPEELVGSSFLLLIPESDRETVMANISALTVDSPSQSHEHRVISLDGEVRWQHWTNHVQFDAQGQAVAYHSIGEDITDRKLAEEERDRLEEQLRHAQKMEAVGQLAGGIAHDFNNILTIILGNAELLKMDPPLAGKQAAFADEVITGAKRAADLTSQLLAFARKGKRQVEPVDINSIVTETVNILTHTIDRRIDIRLELHASPSIVMGDPTQLHGAMLNLGVNARDAMADGGVLTYATRGVTLTKADCDKHPYELTPGDFLEIRITDTGAGMDERTQKRIFEPFFTTKEAGKGTGLGLAGVYGCIRSHDGSISVSSEPGRGAMFTILLPLAAADAAVTGRTVAGDEPVRGTEHVLIVDDEESVRDFVRTSLQSLGYTVSACADGAAGVDYYRRHHQEIDLVILDLIMPRMNGLDAFREMKKIEANVRVLVSSGFSYTQATRQMLDEGALALLNKPFSIAKLSQAVAEHIQHDSSR
ncbi:MAG: transporter substrate-binding domain-containing protein [Phycisphaerae bacterium]|nr:transporter substrate-binding domain-containing protein [Phycisphaerae bacterium]